MERTSPINPQTRDWKDKPGENIVNREVPVFPKKTDAVAEMNTTVNKIVDEERDSDVERQPQRERETSAFPRLFRTQINHEP
jgi:hypothetical protein